MRSVPLLRSCFCALLATALSSRAAALRNQDMVLAIDDSTGCLTELRRPDGPNLLADVDGRALWQLVLRRADGTEALLEPGHARSFAVTPSRGGLRLVWKGVSLPEQPDRLDVTVTITPTTGGRTEWRIAVDGQADGCLWRIDFPRVQGIRSLGTSRLAVPFYLGRIATNPAANGYSLTLAYPQPASMQCFAFWTLPGDDAPATDSGAETGWLPDESAAEGLYLAAEDRAGHYKLFTVKPDKEKATLDWWVQHIPGLKDWPLPADGKLRRVRYESPYPVVLAPFRGDLQEAAVLYHAWASQRIWCQRGKQESWPDQVKPGSPEEALWTPPWFREIGCWLKYYHEPAKILPEFAAYQEWLQVPMASHWYRYGIAKFDDNYNEMLPGDSYLLQGIQDAKALGVQPLPYINGVIWDTDTQSWQRENGLAAAIKDEAGEFVPWDIHGEIFAHMCPTEQWRAKMRETVRKLVGEHGMSGVYLDCLAATGARPCYDPTHGHTVRGGSYRTEGNRKLMHDLRADARSYAPEACFFTEEIGETFVDCMDGFLSLDYLRSYCRPGERVFPFFSLVYHPYTINFGSDAAVGQDPDAFRLQMGTLYTWGCQPLLSTQVAQAPRKGEPTSEFLRELVQHFHHFSRPYLTGGEWVPVSVRTPDSPASARPIDLLVAEHRVEYAKTNKHKRAWTGPAVLASAWKRGDSLAVTMVNITDQNQSVRLSVANRQLRDANGRMPSTQGLSSPSVPRWGHGEMELVPSTLVQTSQTPDSLVMTFVVPAGSSRTYAVRVRGNDPFLFEAQGEFSQAGDEGRFRVETSHRLVSADGRTMISTGTGGRYQVRPVRRQADGRVADCLGKTAGRTSGQAEGHGLPRREKEQPFLTTKSPYTFPWYDGPHGQPRVHDGDESFLLASMSSSDAARFYTQPDADGTPAATALQAVVSVVTDLASGAVVKPLDKAWEKAPGDGEMLCASVENLNETATTAEDRLHRMVTPSLPLPLPASLRREADRLLAHPSDSTLAAASQALRDACLVSGQDPKPFVADRPLAQAMERLHALLCARTAMLPLVEIEDDWLSPGFAKAIRLTPAPGYPDRKPDSIEVVPVGDWPKGTVTVTEQVLDADKATNTHTFTLTLNDGLYVERMVPVLFFLKATRDGHEFIVPEIVRLEANRPLHLIKPIGAAPAIVGREAKVTFTLRNWSPHPFTARLQANAPGFAATPETETVECPALSDTPVMVRFTADAQTRPGSHRIALSAAWANLPDAVSTSCAAVDLRENLVPLAQTGDWTPTPADNRATFRQNGTMVVSAAAGETVRATIRNVRVTRYTNSCKATLRDVDGNTVWQKTIPVDEEAQLAWQAKAAGPHALELNPGTGSAVVEIRNRAVAETASKASPLKLFCSPIRRVFYVPVGAKRFSVGAIDGGLDETAAIRLVSPTGRVALERGLLEAAPARPVPIDVLPDETGKLWQLTITPRQDVSIWLEGDVCSVLSDSPARALRGRE